jgi:hypothetical protein
VGELEYDFCSRACDVEASDVCLSITHICVSDEELERGDCGGDGQRIQPLSLVLVLRSLQILGRPSSLLRGSDGLAVAVVVRRARRAMLDKKCMVRWTCKYACLKVLVVVLDKIHLRLRNERSLT